MSYNIQDLNCLGNQSDPVFEYFRNVSRSKVGFSAQANYALYSTYYGVALVGVFMLKYIAFYLVDGLKPQHFMVKWWWKAVALSRRIAYLRVPLRFASLINMPTSFGTLLVFFVSTLYGLCYLFIPHFWYRICVNFGSPPIAVRAGVMACALTPFIYILAGKTNIISQLTGISYERLQIYHQAVPWLALIFGLVHTFGFVYGDQLEGGLANLKYNFQTQSIYQNGIPPLICLVLLCTLSLPYFRRKYYEIFLHLHWPLGIGYFATLLAHTGNQLNTQKYMYGALAFWSFQLVYRALVKTSFRPRMTTFISPNQAYLKRIGHGTEMFEILIRNNHMKWKPGQHIFIRFDRVRVLDNHPFTIASSYVEGGFNNVRLLVKPAKGITRLIYDKLSFECAQEGVSLFENIYIDGPYGGMPRNVGIFDNVVLIASGSGVTETISFLTSVLRTSKTSTQRIHFNWIVSNESDVSWCEDDLVLAIELAEKRSIELKINVYVSHGTNKGTKNPQITICYEKPNMSQVLQQQYPRDLLKKNVFIVSGSKSLQETVGMHVCKLQNSVLTGNIEEVYLHTEHFGW